MTVSSNCRKHAIPVTHAYLQVADVLHTFLSDPPCGAIISLPALRGDWGFARCLSRQWHHNTLAD